MQEPSLQAGRESSRTRRKGAAKTGLLHGVGGDGLLLPRCYQNTPYQDDLGRDAGNPDRFGLLRLGRPGYSEYVVRDNS
jgi:hypothetical protein